MFRYFLSWRYFFSRRTNLIGVGGIFVAVSVLIMVLSIMTGFLEESRDTLRGSLADIIVEPNRDTRRVLPTGPGPIVACAMATPGVEGAAAHLQWGAIITGGVAEGESFGQIMGSPVFSNLLMAELVGVDVQGGLRVSWPTLRALTWSLGAPLPGSWFQDEFDASDFDFALSRDIENPSTNPYFWGSPVSNPLFPFQPPPRTSALGRPRKGVVVGQQLYRRLLLGRGDTIQLATAVPNPETGELEVNNREFVVSGTFRSGENDADSSRIYLERAEMSDFLGRTREFTQVIVKLEDYEADSGRILAALRTDLDEAGLIAGEEHGPYEVVTWEQFRGNLLGAIRNERILLGIMLSLVLVVAGFTIFAILSLMVTEKRRDIGILTSLGASPRGILSTFVLIAFWDALIGSTLGTIAGIWAALRIDLIERWLSGTASDVLSFFAGEEVEIQIFDRSVYLFDHIPSIVQPAGVVMIVAGAFVCSIVFSAIPAWRASRQTPLQGLRYE